MTRFPNFDRGTFNRFVADEWPRHVHFDSGLRVVFDKDRDHLDVRATEVKLEFLDKAYSAGLRRWFRRCSKGEQLSGCSNPRTADKCECKPIEVFARHLETGRNVEKFKVLMKRAQNLGPELSDGNVDAVIDVHGKFRELFEGRIRRKGHSGKPTNFQSFCSKYLWFHAGVFPVYDTLARTGLRRLHGRGAPSCEKYGDYARAVLALLKIVFPNESGFGAVRIKQVDAFLLQVGDGQNSRKGAA